MCTNGTNGIPISFKVLPMVPLVIMVMPTLKDFKNAKKENYCFLPP